MIDSALMRPGRIDRILYVSPPDQARLVADLKHRAGSPAGIGSAACAKSFADCFLCFVFPSVPSLSFSCAAILSIEFRRIGLAACKLDASSLSSLAAGLSGAEISALCREAALVAMEEDVAARELKEEHFVKARERITPRITKEMIKFYEDYAKRSSVASV